MTNKKIPGKDAKKAWLQASPKQKKIWHFKNRLIAAKARGESEEFIAKLEAERDEVLAKF